MSKSASLEERERREAHSQRAYEIQLEGGLRGAARWTVYGAIACTLAHYSWPLFRKQTLGLKAFLTSSSTIFGLVVGADNHLLKYEHTLRQAENDLRRQARADLAQQGIIATESEIRKWRKRQDVAAEAIKASPFTTITEEKTGEKGLQSLPSPLPSFNSQVENPLKEDVLEDPAAVSSPSSTSVPPR